MYISKSNFFVPFRKNTKLHNIFQIPVTYSGLSFTHVKDRLYCNVSDDQLFLSLMNCRPKKHNLQNLSSGNSYKLCYRYLSSSMEISHSLPHSNTELTFLSLESNLVQQQLLVHICSKRSNFY